MISLFIYVIIAVSLILWRSIMPRVINNDCVACGSCIPECAFDAISEGNIYVIDPNKCTDCAACEAVCPSNAISPA